MTYDVSFADLQEQDVAIVTRDVAMDDIADFLGETFGRVVVTAQEQGIAVTGAPFARFRPTGSGPWQVSAGFPVARPITATAAVEPGVLPAGRVAHTIHRGSYDSVGRAHEVVEDWIAEQGYRTCADPWEAYLDGPDVPEPRTEVFVPCRPVVPGHREPGRSAPD
jgi:effector-binding domain-containing protein